MNIDEKLLSRLKGMDPKELSDKIDYISRIIGADADYIRSVIGSPDDLSKKLSRMNDRDLKKITEKIDPAILNSFNPGDM